jgi:hypothetical protein
MTTPLLPPFTLAVAVALLACGGDDGGSNPLDAGPDAPPGPAREVIGTIDVREQRYLSIEDGTPMEWSSGQARAAFYDGRPPRWHREVARAGACTLRKYTPSSCEPFCDGVCVDTNVCEPWPTLVAAGRLTISGLTTTVRMAGEGGFYYPEAQLPAELFADDAAITAELAGGGGFAGVTLATTGVPALRGAIAGNKLELVHGQEATVRWTSVAGDARVKLTINANNQGHGQPYLAIIECDVADAAGEVTIDASLIADFPETRAWTICAGTDCPPSTLRRYHRATAPVGDFDLELVVACELAFGVDHFLPD